MKLMTTVSAAAVAVLVTGCHHHEHGYGERPAPSRHYHHHAANWKYGQYGPYWGQPRARSGPIVRAPYLYRTI